MRIVNGFKERKIEFFSFAHEELIILIKKFQIKIRMQQVNNNSNNNNIDINIKEMHFPVEDSHSRINVIINPPKRQTTWVGNHAPVAPIATSTMNSCSDVQEIYRRCFATHSNDAQCKAAASYVHICGYSKE